MIPKRSSVTFEELRQFLLGLGFAQTKQDKFWAFEAADNAPILFRPYRVRERVTLLDLHRTRQELERRGTIQEETFDELLKRATA